MKRLIYTATIVLILTSLVPAAYADENFSAYQKVTHFVHSAAHPNNARIQNVTHHFDLHVKGTSLSEISIDIPNGICISQGIEVTDRSGKKVDTSVSLSARKATIAFTQPVAPDTILLIEMKGVKTPGYLGRAWNYLVYTRDVGMTTEIPMGTAEIRTYD